MDSFEIKPEKVEIITFGDEYDGEYHELDIDGIRFDLTKEQVDTFKMKYYGDEIVWYSDAYSKPTKIPRIDICTHVGSNYFKSEEDALKNHLTLKRQRLETALMQTKIAEQILEKELKELDNA